MSDGQISKTSIDHQALYAIGLNSTLLTADLCFSSGVKSGDNTKTVAITYRETTMHSNV